MKHTKNYTLQNVVLALLAPILFMAIYLSANNALSTYVDGEKSRQLSAWSVLQLYKEMRKVNFQSELYINDMGSGEALKVSYEILWSRIPLVHERLLNDQILATSKETGLNTLLAAAFIHIKSIEPMIVNEAPLDKRHLTQWMMTTKQYSDSISMSLLHDLISTDSEYSKTLRNNIIKAAGLLLLSTLSVILYLGYLLFTLWVQRKHHQYLLDHDSLTGLFSRDYTMNLLKSHCEKKTPFTLLSFDVNKFKSINDTLGHMAGDDLLKHLATISNKSLGQHGSVGRIGGDEFFCIAETEDLQDINDCYANFLKLLEKPCSIQGYPAYLHVSTGGCFITDCDFNINLLLERVDEAMYRAKKISQEGIFWYGNPIKGEKTVAKLVVG